MHLINASTMEFHDMASPTNVTSDEYLPYYILSHRWGAFELSHADVQSLWSKHDSTARLQIESKGYSKIANFCRFARQLHGARSSPCYVWIDTCCIDKKSSAELTEDINSMWNYYSRSAVCCVHLSDVDYHPSNPNREVLAEHLSRSSWFTRGWTLQELLAPKELIFLNTNWQIIGHKCNTHYHTSCTLGHTMEALYSSSGMVILNDILANITGIGEEYLSGDVDISDASVARRMSWAAFRSTTRVEDVAYCLMGLFGVNMPLLYGEGRKAFQRLQEEIIKQSTDHSIFACTRPWRGSGANSEHVICAGIFARQPCDFARSGNVCTLNPEPSWPYSVTNAGLLLRCLAHKAVSAYVDAIEIEIFVVKLNCVQLDGSSNAAEDAAKPVEITLREIGESSKRAAHYGPRHFEKVYWGPLELMPYKITGPLEEMEFYIRTVPESHLVRYSNNEDWARWLAQGDYSGVISEYLRRPHANENSAMIDKGDDFDPWILWLQFQLCHLRGWTKYKTSNHARESSCSNKAVSR